MLLEKSILHNLMQNPTGGISSYFLVHYMNFMSRNITKKAVKVLNVKPDHRVLQIGFGGGLGLKTAYKKIEHGKGKLYGVDNANYFTERMEQIMHKEILHGKLELHTCDVSMLPFINNRIDRVFHTHHHHYWIDQVVAIKEIRRVMKCGGLMVSGLFLDKLHSLKQYGIIEFSAYDPLNYMLLLESCGFRDVHIEYFGHKSDRFQIIFATAN